MVRIADYPQLSLIAWNRSKDDLLDETEALALYERNWRYVDQEALGPQEKALLHELTKHHGNCCFAPI